MASNNDGFKPGEVKVPKVPDQAPKGSGADYEDRAKLIERRQQFTEPDLEGLKDMVAGADPGEVGRVAQGWMDVRVSLVGGSRSWESSDWDGGIKHHFDTAVNKVLQTWSGKSAEQFAATAQKISENFGKLAAFPHSTGHVLHQIGERLTEAKGFVDGLEEPGMLDSLGDKVGDSLGSTGKGAGVGTMVAGPVGTAAGAAVGFFTGGRDDSQLKADLKNPDMTIWDAMNKNSGQIPADKEVQLQGAHYMEQLATTYRAGVKAMGKPPTTGGGKGPHDDEVPEHDGGGSVPPIGSFGPTPKAPNGGAAPNIPGMKGGGYQTPTPMETPRTSGIDGGIGSMPKTPAPNPGTSLDGLSGGGLGTGGGGSGLSGGAGGGVGGGVGAGGGLGAGSGAGGGSGGGMSGAGGGGMPGMVGGAGGRAGGAGGGAGARAGGRAGMPGMGGGAAGAGKGAGAGGKGSALARQKGGVVGGKGGGGKSGVGGQGGSGLHRSRGGSQQSGTGTGGRRPTGMAGAPGAHGGKGKDKADTGQRPDYLVEDEETWTQERNVAPKVIE